MSAELLRVYFDPQEIAPPGHRYAGYPFAWFALSPEHPVAIKGLIRQQAGHRCQRCGHPYRSGEHGNGQWSGCDSRCTHAGPWGIPLSGGVEKLGNALAVVNFASVMSLLFEVGRITLAESRRTAVLAEWRILTVHHLNGVKHDCRWANLVALCQRCHLTIQGKVLMDRSWRKPHSEWFKVYAAAHYARIYLGEDLTREQVENRLDELLDLELREVPLF